MAIHSFDSSFNKLLKEKWMRVYYMPGPKSRARGRTSSLGTIDVKQKIYVNVA